MEPIPEGPEIKNLQKVLNSLSSTTNWIIGALVVTAFTAFSSSTKVFGFDVDKDKAGLALFTIVTGLNFYILKLSKSLQYFYSKVENKQAAKNILQQHLWIGNPFAKGVSDKSSFFDSIGYCIFILLWWVGFILGFKLSFTVNTSLISLVAVLLLIVLFSWVGIATGLLFGKAPWEKRKSFSDNVTPNKVREVLSLVAIVIGWFFFLCINWKEIKILAGLIGKYFF